MQKSPSLLHARLHSILREYADSLSSLHTALRDAPIREKLFTALNGTPEMVDRFLLLLQPRVRTRFRTALTAQAVKDAHAELEKEYRKGYQFICAVDPTYPALLREIAQPPLGIYVAGAIELLENSARPIAFVGTRKPTSYGKTAARRLVAEATRAQWTVVSGLALGIDSIAHEQALQSGGRTIAVLGGGIAQRSISPRRHVQLSEEIVSNEGLILSEYPFHTESRAHFFPQRNRIIAGLSHITVVVEAAEKSGSLITARHALEENREVWSVPGEIFSTQSQGNNALLAAGAAPILSEEHLGSLLQQFANDRGWEHSPYITKASMHLARAAASTVSARHSDLQQQILDAIGKPSASASLDSIASRSGLSLDVLHLELVQMELLGVVEMQASGEYLWK